MKCLPGKQTDELERRESSLQNLQSVEPQKIPVAFHRTPARIRMTIQHRQLELLYCAVICRGRASVIDDPVMLPVWRNARRAQKDHHVIGKLLHPRLVIEKEIAGLSFASIATDEYHVEIFQRAAIGEFGKLRGSFVAFVISAKIGAK